MNVIANDDKEARSSLETEINELQIAFDVHETRYSRHPTSDRAKVVDIMRTLSESSVRALKEDYFDHRRYATHAKLINQVKDRRTGQYVLEEFNFRPPQNATTFNELDENEMEFLLCKLVLDLDATYVFYKVRICFDYFIDEKIRQLVAEINEEDEVPFLTSTLEEPRPSTSRAAITKESSTSIPPINNLGAARVPVIPNRTPSSSKQTNGIKPTMPTPPTPSTKPNQPIPARTPLPSLGAKRTSEAILRTKRPRQMQPKQPDVAPPTQDDDDSDVEIVFEKPKGK